MFSPLFLSGCRVIIFFFLSFPKEKERKRKGFCLLFQKVGCFSFLLLFSFDNSNEKRMKRYLTKIGKRWRKSGKKAFSGCFYRVGSFYLLLFFLKKRSKRKRRKRLDFNFIFSYY